MQVAKLFKGMLNGNKNITVIDWTKDEWTNVSASINVSSSSSIKEEDLFEVYTLNDAEKSVARQMSVFNCDEVDLSEKPLEVVIDGEIVCVLDDLWTFDYLVDHPELNLELIINVCRPVFVKMCSLQHDIHEDDEDYYTGGDAWNMKDDFDVLLSKSSKVTMDLLLKYKDEVEWDWDVLSARPDMDIKDMMEHPQYKTLPWKTRKGILMNPNLTEEQFYQYNIDKIAAYCIGVLHSPASFLKSDYYQHKYRLIHNAFKE
jgi:hypothetical protein